MDRIGLPSCEAWVRRVVKERPSWMRSTEKVISFLASPGRKK